MPFCDLERSCHEVVVSGTIRRFVTQAHVGEKSGRGTIRRCRITPRCGAGIGSQRRGSPYLSIIGEGSYPLQPQRVPKFPG